MAREDIIASLRLEAAEKFKRSIKDASKELRNAEKSADSLNDELSETEKTTGRLPSSFKKVGAAVAAAFATAKISQFIQESVKLANIQLQSEAQLLSALKGREDVQKRLLQQAKDIQSTTTFGDEEIVAQQAYLANLGYTEQAIRGIIDASVDLSAGANISLESSVRNLAKTYSGLTGELGESIPQLRELTKEQLQNGEGVKVITRLYEGQAEVLRTTGTGAVKALNNAVGDLQEEFGKAVIEGVVPLANTLQEIAESEEVIQFFESLGKILGTTLSVINQSVQGYQKLFNILGGSSERERAFQEQLSQTSERGLAFLQARLLRERDEIQNAEKRSRSDASEIRAINEKIELIKQYRAELAGQYVRGGEDEEAAVAAINEITDTVENFTFRFNEFLGEINSGLSAIQPNADFAGAALEKMGEDGRSAIELLIEALEEGNKKVKEFQEGLIGDNALQTGGFENFQSNAPEAIDRLGQVEDRALNVSNSINKVDEAIDKSTELRLNRLDNLRRRGQIDEKTFARERAKILRQESIFEKITGLSKAGINTAIAVTKVLGNPFAVAAVSLAGAAQAGIIGSTPIPDIPQFNKGTKFVKGDGFPDGIDTVPALLTKGERVTTKDKNRKYWRVLNGIDNDDIGEVLRGFASMGVPVQFKDPVKDIVSINHGGGLKGKGSSMDWSPMLFASDQSRLYTGYKLDRLHNDLVQLNNNLSKRGLNGRI